MSMTRPLFLSLDGIDGTGKSTQCNMLVEALRKRGREVTFCVDPGGTELGARLREVLLKGEYELAPKAEAMLFMASRAQLIMEVIRPALERNEVVVSDRFLLANVVYQGHAGGLDPHNLWDVGKFAADNLLPDLTVVLDLPVEEAEARRGRPADRMEKRSREYHEKVRQGFLLEAAADPVRIHVVDAGPPAEQVHEAVWWHVVPLLMESGGEG
jgi:dTMP kinase